MRSFSLSFSVSSSLSSCWRGSSSKKKKTNRCRQTTSRNFTVASLKSDENDDDDDRTTTTTPVGMVVVKEEAKEKLSSPPELISPCRTGCCPPKISPRYASFPLQKRVVSRILNFFLEGCLSSFLSKLTKTPLKQQQTG